MVSIGDTVTYHAGGQRGDVPAEIRAVNEDGTVNLVYPHWLDESEMATADNCREGTAGFEFEVPGETAPRPVGEETRAAWPPVTAEDMPEPPPALVEKPKRARKAAD